MSELQVIETSGDVQSPDGIVITGDTLVIDVTDGRKLTLTYPGPLAQFDLVDAMGAAAAENARLVRMYLPLIYLSAIDSQTTLLPTSLREMRALIARLGHKGLAALQRGVKAFDERDENEMIPTAKK
jgi:hypothetical protein